ncbi:MAG: hypothetical protein IKY25_03505 [Alistipes sp.]|nr:hypothetical protein [Alistipes sp.]
MLFILFCQIARIDTGFVSINHAIKCVIKSRFCDFSRYSMAAVPDKLDCIFQCWQLLST